MATKNLCLQGKTRILLKLKDFSSDTCQYINTKVRSHVLDDERSSAVSDVPEC